jgi:uncharacterized lipoprotein YmbA
MARGSARLSAEDALMAHMRTVRYSLLMAAMATLLAACGGGSSDSATNQAPTGNVPNVPITPTQPEVVTGVATPDSVAVVTATNAG